MPTKRATSFFLQIASFLVVTATIANAQITVIPTRAAYTAVEPANTVVTFEGLGSGTMYPSGITLSGVTFAGINGATAESVDGSVFGVPGTTVLVANNGQFNTDSFQIALPAGTFAFGTDFKGAGSFAAEPYLFTLFSGATSLGSFATAATSTSAFSFIGFSSASSPITSVQIQVTGAIGTPEPLIDNFTVAVPEPSTWILMLGSGTLLLALQRYRRL